ncbi:MAG: hypothetical protein ACRDRZ_07875 [Pseudonocardiaceae bacterium]
MLREQEHWLSCRDAVGRQGAAAVIVRDGELVVMVPAGEAAVFRFDQLDQADHLRVALALGIDQVRDQIRRQGR